MSLPGQREQIVQITCEVFSNYLNVFGMERKPEQATGLHHE